MSGTLNSVERTYYNRNSNIKNTIDTYLIQRNFSNMAKSDSQAALALGQKLGLNFEQFNWVFNNRDSEELAEIQDFLNENIISNQSNNDFKNFANAAVEAIMDGGEVDFENEIIKDKSFIGTPADCVLKALISSGNNLFKNTSEAFTGNNSEHRIRFTTIDKPNDNAIARTDLPDENGIININFNLSQINQPSIDMAGAILHETIHAELHRIKFSNNAAPNSLPAECCKWYSNRMAFSA